GGGGGRARSPWRRSMSDTEDEVYAEVAETVRLSLEAGRAPDVAALTARFPQMGDEIPRVVQMVTALHQLGTDTEPAAPPAPAARRPARPPGRIGEDPILPEIARGGMGSVSGPATAPTR